jgi:hypothetical protein
MLGWIVLGGLGISAIKAGIQNADMMSKPYRHLDNGTPVYLDRECHEYINGERVTVHYDYSQPGVMNTQLVGTKSGKVYVDRRKNFLDKIAQENEEERQKALSEGKLAYVKLYPHNSMPECTRNTMTDTRLTCECSSGRVIGKLTREADGTCYKYYVVDFKDPTFYAVLGTNLSEPVEISEDEFERLNIKDLWASQYVVDHKK